MKKLLLFLFVCIFISGCSEQPAGVQPEENIKNNEEEIVQDIEEQKLLLVEVKPDNYNIDELPEFFNFSVTNISEELFLCGYMHEIECFTNGKWEKIPFIESTSFILLRINLFSGDVYDFSSYRSAYDYNFKTGRYRIVYFGHYGEFTIS
ncbi:MAG: hypothetical protein FWG44_01755 [Oscillospiraceae bacterium]|nr:hypothetical protein [Oscillospiraceae bacterium]